MLEALFSFLGGSVFRMIWGEVSSWHNKKIDHEHEMAQMRLQGDLEQAAHERTMASLRLQSELGIKTIEAQSDADVAKAEADAFVTAMKDAMKPTGIAWVDAWNSIIRPAAATMALVLWAFKIDAQHYVMQDWDLTLAGTVLGFFFASRELSKRGK